MQKHEVVPKFVANSNNSDPGGPTIGEERKQSIKESASIASLFPPNYSDTDDSSESNETLPRFSHYSNSIMELFSPARSSVSSGSSGASYFSHYSNYIMELFSPAMSSVSSGSGGASYFSTGNGPTTFRFNPRNADDTFAEFLGFSGPFGSMGGMGGGGGGVGGMIGSRFSSGIIGDDGFASFGEGGGGGGFMHQGAPRKGAPIESRLPCSLEELYKGATKKMKLSKKIADISGKTIQVEEILTIEIKPGWKKGTKITFPEKGNEQPNVIPADLVFIIDEKPHSVFTRDGNDLIVTQKISLADALTGYAVHLTTLDGRTLNIPINNVINPNYEEVVPREGMPNYKDPTKKGNLRIRFNIKFPTWLTTEQKAGIKKLLGP